MSIDTKELITNNYEVLNILVDNIIASKNSNQIRGSASISQMDVHIPNFKYAIGSFTINYVLIGELSKINIESDYKFRLGPNRITKYLHIWMYSLAIKSYADEFHINGNNWLISTSKLISLKSTNIQFKYPKLKMLA